MARIKTNSHYSSHSPDFLAAVADRRQYEADAARGSADLSDLLDFFIVNCEGEVTIAPLTVTRLA